jgi:GNAT superfamily N-acetyltransferase
VRTLLHRYLDRWRGAHGDQASGRGPRAALTSVDFRIRTARDDDAEAIATLYNGSLGSGYATPEGIAADVRDCARCAFYVAELQGSEAMGEVVGAANAVWVAREEVLSIGVAGFLDVQEEILALGGEARRFGLLENVAVRPDLRGHGVGSALVEARLEWFRRQSVEFAYSFAWKTPQGCPSQGVLLRQGFRRVREMRDFYLEDGLVNGYACPFCGTRCHCSAILFVRTVQ